MIEYTQEEKYKQISILSLKNITNHCFLFAALLRYSDFVHLYIYKIGFVSIMFFLAKKLAPDNKVRNIPIGDVLLIIFVHTPIIVPH
jgi:hypothetical protein